MDQRIYGTLICQNAIPEILRCIESMAPYVDEFFIMDGWSEDGTWEWLKKYKNVYKLNLFQHPYKDQGEQRNKLLAKIPKGSWCLNIDQDEEVKCEGFREFINNVSPDLLAGRGRDLPLTVRFPCINLAKDILHYNDDVRFFATKCFYNDRNLHFTPGYHMSICYFETEQNTNAVPVPENWVVKHYAYLNPDRGYQDPKRVYTKDEFDVSKWKILDLPKEWI